MKKFNLVFVSFLLISILSSCNLVVDRLSKQYGVDFNPKELNIAQGDSATFKVEVKPLAGPLTVAITQLDLVTNLPSGITVEPRSLSIPSGAEPKTITITVAKTAAPLQNAKIKFEAVRDGLAAYPILNLSVTESSQ